MFHKTAKNSIRAGMTVAALALTVAACPAQAQFNSINGANSFFPTGPRVFAPLGGGVLGSQNFNSGFAFNPALAGFNQQLVAFNSQRSAAPAEFPDYNAVLANFNAQRSAFISNAARFNSAPNAPLSNFSPSQDFVFTGTGFNQSNQVNPSLNPAFPSASGVGSFGFNGFNTFNPLSNFSGFQTTSNLQSGFNTLNSGFGGFGAPVTAAQVQRVTRAASANVSLPNPPASRYANTIANPSIATGSSTTMQPWYTQRNLNATNGPNNWPSQFMDVSPGRMQTNYSVGIPQAAVTGSTFQAPVLTNTFGPKNWPSPFMDARAAVTQYSMGVHGNAIAPTMLSPMASRVPVGNIIRNASVPRFGYPGVIGSSKSAFGAGLGAGATVMGGRAR